MTQKSVAPYTTTDLYVPYGQKIAISTYGGELTTIWYQTIGASPAGWYVNQRISNEEVLLGTFSADQYVRIETQGNPVLYDIGVSPAVGVGDASSLNGYVQDSSDTVDTIALRDSSGDIQANAFESTVATGTAPFTVASTTVVTNLNTDKLDNLEASQFLRSDVADTKTGSLIINDSGEVLTLNRTTANEGLLYLKNQNVLGALIGTDGTDLIFYNKSTAETLRVLNSGDAVIANNKFIAGKDTGGTARNLAGISGSDQALLGSYDNSLRLLSSDNPYVTNDGGSNWYFLWHAGNDSSLAHIAGVETFTGLKTFANDVYLNNNKFILGKETGGTVRTLIGVDNSDNVYIGSTALSAAIYSNGTVNIPAGNMIINNNYQFRGKDTSSNGRNLASIDNSDITQIANTNLPTNIQSNGTLTYNGASLATGSIDTTAAQTITVVDGLITSIV